MRTLYFMSILIASSVNASFIQEIDSFKQALPVLENVNKNTLVLFDVDETLFVGSSKVFWPSTIQRYKEQLDQLQKEADKKVRKPLTQEYKDFLFSKIVLKNRRRLIEQEAPTIIKKLQDKEAQVLALTAVMTGSFHVIPSLPQFRFEQLQQVGIDFRPSAPSLTIIFNTFDSHNNCYPLLYKGILFACARPKGEVMGAFLDHINWQPEHIVFFDDTLKHIKSVVVEAQKRSIPVSAYHYKGASRLPTTFEPEIVALQFNHLMEHEEWLTDEEARLLLNILANTKVC